MLTGDCNICVNSNLEPDGEMCVGCGLSRKNYTPRCLIMCDAVKQCIVKYKGKPSLEYFYDCKPYYYCYGYIDMQTDELLDVCKKCRKNVIYAQEDLDKLLNKNRCHFE